MEQDKELKVRVIAFDTITSYSGILDSDDSIIEPEAALSMTRLHKLTELWANFAYSDAQATRQNHEIQEDFSLTLTVGLDHVIPAEDNLNKHLTDFSRYTLKLFIVAHETNHILKPELRLGDLESLETNAESGNGNYEHFMKNTHTAYNGPRVFRTQRGNLNPGPQVLEDCDLSCVPFGARVRLF